MHVRYCGIEVISGFLIVGFKRHYSCAPVFQGSGVPLGLARNLITEYLAAIDTRNYYLNTSLNKCDSGQKLENSCRERH